MSFATQVSSSGSTSKPAASELASKAAEESLRAALGTQRELVSRLHSELSSGQRLALRLKRPYYVSAEAVQETDQEQPFAVQGTDREKSLQFKEQIKKSLCSSRNQGKNQQKSLQQPVRACDRPEAFSYYQPVCVHLNCTEVRVRLHLSDGACLTLSTQLLFVSRTQRPRNRSAEAAHVGTTLIV